MNAFSTKLIPERAAYATSRFTTLSFDPSSGKTSDARFAKKDSTKIDVATKLPGLSRCICKPLVYTSTVGLVPSYTQFFRLFHLSTQKLPRLD